MLFRGHAHNKHNQVRLDSTLAFFGEHHADHSSEEITHSQGQSDGLLTEIEIAALFPELFSQRA